MPGGLLQLAAYGSENDYLNGNPQITFFKLVYRRHTNFAMENIEVNLQGPQSLSFDKSSKLKVKIPRNGDLLSNMYLTLKLPNIISNDNKQFYWIQKLGINIIDYCDLFIGGSKIERLEGAYLDLYYQLNKNEKNNNSFREMIGDDPFISSINNNNYYGYNSNKFENNNNHKYINKFYKSPPSIFERYLNIPLAFWFTKNFGLSLPLIALQYHDIDLEIQFKPVKDLYTILTPDKTYYHYNSKSHYFSNNIDNDRFIGKPNAARTNAAMNKELSIFSYSYRKKPDTINQNEHISQFISGTFNHNTWDLEPILNITYIYLDNNERKVFAEITHEYLIEQVIKIEKTGLQGSNIIELEAFHPIKEIMFIANRDDNYERNQWSNYTTNPTYIENNDIYKFQNTWWQDCVETSINNPILFNIEINLQSVNIQCDQFQELLFRYGPNGEAHDDAPSALQSILGFTISPSYNIYTLSDITSFRNCWNFYKAIDIPLINQSNFEIYRNNPLIDCKIKFNGQSRQEKHRQEFYRYIQPYQHHKFIPDQPIYLYSFSIKPEEYQPSGACNFSRLKNIEMEINLKNTPIAKKQISGNNNITREWLYDMHFYLINYNILKIASGLGGLAFGN